MNNPKHVADEQVRVLYKNMDGRRLNHKSVTDDKTYNLNVANAAVGQAQLRYETATLAFGVADTVITAAVTAGSIVLGAYVSSVTGSPAFADLKLGIASTTLTGTRATAPGAGTAITYTVVLLKT